MVIGAQTPNSPKTKAANGFNVFTALFSAPRIQQKTSWSWNYDIHMLRQIPSDEYDVG